VAFPAGLTPTVNGLAPLIDPPGGRASGPTFSVRCNGELLHLPARIYRPPISETNFAALNDTEQRIAACWFTRHHDGYVRERFLRTLPAFDNAWIIAYVITLCGEYVIEILNYIWEHRSLFAPEVLGPFLHENLGLRWRTRARIISYWNRYYRDSYPNFDDYVGSHLLNFFDDCLAKHVPEN
jgi:hypothetical protein